MEYTPTTTASVAWWTCPNTMASGKSLRWDVTVVSTPADSYLYSTSHSTGGIAEAASARKVLKYSAQPPDYMFQLIALETHGLLNSCSLEFPSEVSHRLSASTGDLRETSSMFECLSILISASTPFSHSSHSVQLTKIRTTSHLWYLFLEPSGLLHLMAKKQ